MNVSITYTLYRHQAYNKCHTLYRKQTVTSRRRLKADTPECGRECDAATAAQVEMKAVKHAQVIFFAKSSKFHLRFVNA